MSKLADLARYHLLLAVILATGCATTLSTRAPAGGPSPEATLDEDGPALLLLMADQLLFEPFAVQTIFREFPELHERLAVTLGRIGDSRGLPYLESLLADPAVDVRRAAAFGLGQLGDKSGFPALLGALGDGDREVGRLAVDALARLGRPLVTIESALGVLTREEAEQRMLPLLFRFTPDEIHRVETALADRQAERTSVEAVNGGALDPELERWLFYALARSGDERGLPRLRLALEHSDPWIRGWVARALGRLGERADLGKLRGLLEDNHQGVVVQALRAASRLIDRGEAAAPDTWLVEIEGLIDDPRPWVRLTALESVGSWMPSPGLGKRLRSLATGDQGRAGELALISLARGGDLDSEQLILRAASSGRSAMRRAAALAAAIAGLEGVLDELRSDPETAVRVAALGAILERSPEVPSLPEGATSRVELVAREALLDRDPGMRALAFDWLSTNPVAPVDELLLALTSESAERLPDLKISGARALSARALQQPLERGVSVAALERLAESSNYLVRRAGGEALLSLGREQPKLGSLLSSRTLRDYRSIASTLAPGRRVELVLGRGVVVLELDTKRAPLTSVVFLQLAAAGFYDGLEFHRVIADFVAQGGDPRGDGWGGPGFSVRDENSRVPFERGVVGMARSESHTAGSQFFLTLSRQPHLDGSYTAFGRVVSGEEWLDLIEQGDSILRIREIKETSAVSSPGEK